MGDERLHASQTPGDPSQLQRLSHTAPGLDAAPNLEGERAAEPAELIPRQLVLGMTWQPGVVDGFDRLVLGEE
jgi:hypothetical protein